MCSLQTTLQKQLIASDRRIPCFADDFRESELVQIVYRKFKSS